MTTKKKAQAAAKGKRREVTASIENLAELIVGVLAHPDTPPEIYQHLLYGLSECHSSNGVNYHVGYVAAILAENPTEGGARDE